MTRQGWTWIWHIHVMNEEQCIEQLRLKEGTMAGLLSVRLFIQGLTPLLMHNERLADPFDVYTKQLSAVTSKRRKTEDDQLLAQKIEWTGGLYWNEKLGPYIPGANVKRCIQGGGQVSKRGKDVLRGVFPREAEVPLSYTPNVRDLDAMWDAGCFLDRRSVRLTGSRKIMRVRPKFMPWSLETRLYLNPAIVDPDLCVEWLRLAGQVEGLGDYRPTMGQFKRSRVEGRGLSRVPPCPERGFHGGISHV